MTEKKRERGRERERERERREGERENKKSELKHDLYENVGTHVNFMRGCKAEATAGLFDIRHEFRMLLVDACNNEKSR